MTDIEDVKEDVSEKEEGMTLVEKGIIALLPLSLIVGAIFFFNRKAEIAAGDITTASLAIQSLGMGFGTVFFTVIILIWKFA